MRVIRNTGYIKRRKRAAKFMVLAGLMLLGGSWVVTLFYPNLFIAATVGLVLGFLGFNGGMQQIGRWSRRPRADKVLDDQLARLNDRYTLIHYPDFPGRRPDHILVMPTGVLVMSLRELSGRALVKGKMWRKKGSPLGRMFMLSAPQLGNPTIENEEQVRAVTSALTEHGMSAEVKGAIVFVALNIEVEIIDSDTPVLHVTELLDYIRDDLGGDVSVSGRDRERIVEQLARGDELERNAVAPARARKKVRAA
ncbi:MAG TPA: nuclease-related domain-containing protein [Thermomicrobiales bacterium]|nr:nuclease-related domain-containing protein [Thermomicrobiales bacterium]